MWDCHGTFLLTFSWLVRELSWHFQDGSIGLVMCFVDLHRLCHALCSWDFVTPVWVSKNTRMPPNYYGEPGSVFNLACELLRRSDHPPGSRVEPVSLVYEDMNGLKPPRNIGIIDDDSRSDVCHDRDSICLAAFVCER